VADIFVSYSHQDRTRCQAVCAFLRQRYSVAVDTDFLHLGEAFRPRIEEEARIAKVAIVLWSKKSVESPFVRDEASRSSERKALLQLVIDDLEQVPLGFGELQWHRCGWTEQGELDLESRAALTAALERQLPAAEPLAHALAIVEKEVNDRLGSECDLLERLGTGRVSLVFKARHSTLGLVALKVTPLSGILLLPGFYADFRSSLEAAMALTHPHIQGIRGVRLLDNVACTTLDFVDGTSLRRCLARATERLPLGRIKEIARGVASALAYAHTKNVVHAGLTPANILIESGSDRAVVCDFTAPRRGGGPEATAARALFLDARYLSPEQCVGKQATPQSDQYAFGAVLYEMLTGRPPFLGDAPFSIMRGHVEQTPEPIRALRPHCPVAVEECVLQLLEKKPRARFFTTSLLLHEIESWPIAEASGAPESTSPARCSSRTALESYNRCLNDPSFLPTFYERLREQPALSEKLASVNFDRLVDKFKAALRHLLEFGRGQADARLEIESLAAGHVRFQLQAEDLQAFTETLITLAVERDNAVAQTDRDALREHWRAATRDGILRFTELAAAAPAPFSGVTSKRVTSRPSGTSNTPAAVTTAVPPAPERKRPA
jgi:serine/threonine protein kinase